MQISLTKDRIFMNFNQIGKEENKKKIMCGFKKKN